MALTNAQGGQNVFGSLVGDTSVRIWKMRLPIFSIGLNEKTDDSTYTVVKDKTITTVTFRFLGDYTSYGEFMDGYGYGFSNEGNSSGSAKMLWIKSSKADYSFMEGEWTLSNAKLIDFGFTSKWKPLCETGSCGLFLFVFQNSNYPLKAALNPY